MVRMQIIELNTNVSSIEELYEQFVSRYKSAWFYETLIDLANRPEVDSVIELGVKQGGSTSAFLTCNISCLVSCDITFKHLNKGLFERLLPEGIMWVLLKIDSTIVPVGPCDLLMIDTVHTYDHVTKELSLQADSVRHYIAIHDANYPKGEADPRKTVRAAIQDFAEGTKWEIIKDVAVGTGMIVLKNQS